MPYDAAKDCLQRLDLGYRAAYQRLRQGKRPCFPRFRRDTTSFTWFPRSEPWIPGPGRTWRLKLPKAGAIPVRRHRPPPVGKLKLLVVSREGTEWYATLQYEVAEQPPPANSDPVSPLGVDLGLIHLVTLSTGETIEPNRFLLRKERRLNRLQRTFSRRRRGSNRWRSQKERLAKCHRRIRNQRRHWAHQLTNRWAARHDFIAFEDFDVASFSEGNRLAKGMADAGWGLLRQLAAYKERLRSGWSVEVSARETSQTCSRCGKLSNPPMSLHDRIFRCSCGHQEDRDVNAARNILKRGLGQLRRNTTEGMRVEGMPPPTRMGRRAYQRKREATVSVPRVPEGRLAYQGPGPPTR